MNSNTKEALKEFADAVSDLAMAASSFIGTDATETIVNKVSNLISAIDHDETL